MIKNLTPAILKQRQQISRRNHEATGHVTHPAQPDLVQTQHLVFPIYPETSNSPYSIYSYCMIYISANLAIRKSLFTQFGPAAFPARANYALLLARGAYSFSKGCHTSSRYNKTDITHTRFKQSLSIAKTEVLFMDHCIKAIIIKAYIAQWWLDIVIYSIYIRLEN